MPYFLAGDRRFICGHSADASLARVESRTSLGFGPLAPRNLLGERIELRFPEPTERFEPRIDFPQRVRVQRVDPASAVDVHAGEPVIPRHLEVLGKPPPG